MQVGQTTSATTTTSTSAANALQLDPNMFLQLLTTQLQNQDPTAPADTNQMMGQLATLSSVEQSVQTNQKLDSLLTSSSITQAGLLVGQTISSADGTQSGAVPSVSIASDGATATLSDGSTLALDSGIKIGS